MSSLKEALCKAPVIRSPNFNRPFILQTDASERALGAVLSQRYPNGEHPIVFLSKKLHPAKSRYSTIEREMLAIKWAVETLQYYLSSNLFTLVTDHAPFQWLHKVNDSNPRILRWYLALSHFSFQVVHQKGHEHIKADTLSRYPEIEARSGGGVCVAVSRVSPARTGGSAHPHADTHLQARRLGRCLGDRTDAHSNAILPCQ